MEGIITFFGRQCERNSKSIYIYIYISQSRNFMWDMRFCQVTHFLRLSHLGFHSSKFAFMSNFQFIECTTGVNIYINYLQMCTNCVCVQLFIIIKKLYKKTKTSCGTPCNSTRWRFVRIVFHLAFPLAFFIYFGL